MYVFYDFMWFMYKIISIFDMRQAHGVPRQLFKS